MSGATIAYYNNYADALAKNSSYIALQGNTWIIGDTANIGIGGNIGHYTSWRVAAIDSINAVPGGIFSNGYDFGPLEYQIYLYPPAPCFLEGTKILCLVNGLETYIPIETIVPGTLVKTSRDAYKKVELIGKGTIQNPATTARIEKRVYRCSTAKYPELKEDLYITGCHSILVDSLSDAQREKITKRLGKVFVTDKKYRLLAYIDERAEPWNSWGIYTIWHLALENVDENMNYGIYANGGLLVETCCINRLKNKSNMDIL